VDSSLNSSDATAQDPATDGGGHRGAFVTTRWSVVLTAGRSDSTRAQSALSTLCQAYWYPLYAYVRRRGYNPHDAQDLTQEFFARLLEHNWLARASRERGRFRTFLLSALSHFLANEWDKARSKKRGGAVQFLPLQLDTAETRYGAEPPDTVTPEQCYERRWALALLDHVLTRLGDEYRAEQKGELFELLKPCFAGERQSQPYASLGAKLGMSEGAVKVAVHRMRHHYREILKEEIAQTVSAPDEVEEEMRYLLTVLAK
jgi:RNA polymerase sigma-70 factor (ECF subfamily)